MSKTRMTKQLREYRRVSEAEGATMIGVVRNGHQHVTLSVDGVTKVFVIGSSDSDKRAIKNHRANVRRWVEDVRRHKKTEGALQAPHTAREAGPGTHAAGV